MDDQERGEEREPIGPDAAVELEQMVFGPSASEAAAAREIFKEGLVPAATQLVHLSQHSKNDKLRADCAKYVVERNLGKVAEKMANGDIWTDLLSDITVGKSDSKE
jgi:hypothetical protein